MRYRTQTAPTLRPIFFFDGECGLCNGLVNFLLRHDKKALLLFSPLQGKTAEQDLSPVKRDGQSAILLAERRLYERSDAILHTLRLLGLPWSLLYSFRLIPRPLRNAVYDLVARYRYRIWGRQTCRIPSPAERARFLD